MTTLRLHETDHRITVPLDHGRPDGASIEVYARVVAADDGRDRPLLVYLEGGPGSEAPRPVVRPGQPAWLERALQEFRVVLLDQRGTGLSTPFGLGTAGWTTPAEQAEHLTGFRADAIVADAELVRAHLGAEQWSVLGQSFGGFCALHYLGVAPQSLREVLFTGGLPPMGAPLSEVYAETYSVMAERNADHHRRYPGDLDRLRVTLDACRRGEAVLLDGTVVTPRLLRTVGNRLGMAGGSEQVHHLLERDPRSPGFAAQLEALLPFGGHNPLYSVLQESCYADGLTTGWAADRAAPSEFADDDAVLLTGEHLFPWHFTDRAPLRPYAEVAHLLADHAWPRLYDEQALAACEVPAAAAVFTDDPFVTRRFSEQTGAVLPRLRTWVTEHHSHNALHTDGPDVLDRLLTLARSR